MPAKSVPTVRPAGRASVQISSDFWDSAVGTSAIPPSKASIVDNFTKASPDYDIAELEESLTRSTTVACAVPRARKTAKATKSAKVTHKKSTVAPAEQPDSPRQPRQQLEPPVTPPKPSTTQKSRHLATPQPEPPTPPKSRQFTGLKNAITEDLFNDLYQNRKRIYLLNFTRGVYFGLGAFIGGTVIIAAVVALLSWLVQTFPDFADYIQWLVDILSRK